VDLGTFAFGSSLATARAVDAIGRPDDREVHLPVAGTLDQQEPEEPDDGRPLLAPSGADAVSPAEVASGRAPMWLIALVNREAAIAPLQQTARTAVSWAVAMVVAVTAILVSSAIQLIRARSRFERLRTELIDREMREARHIQLMWLPDDAIRQTPTRQIEIAAHNVPASHISGDFYNYFDLPDGRTAVVIGDVTGHGMTAAFLMATTQLLVRTTLQRLGDPGKTLEEVNDQLCTQAFHGQFVTIQLLVINTRTRELLAASAGHPPPLTRSASGHWEALDIEPQLVLGVLEGSKYPTLTIPLEGRETLVMYTEGIIEVKNPAGVRFSLEQLLEQMSRRIGSRVNSARDLVEETFSLIREFTADTPQDDDLTLVAVHLSPHASGANPMASSRV
jgi:serine phosphatase RsbU (regulator of sigma subunit)